MKNHRKTSTFGLIVGNRDFFPGHLAASDREMILKVLEQEGYRAIALSPEETRYGAINLSQSASAVQEALDKYLDWDVYRHE